MHPYGILSLLPAAVAIGLALWSRNVVLSLGLAVLVSALLASGGDVVGGVLHTVDPILLDALADRDHMKVTVFSLLVAATVGVMTQSKAAEAMVGALLTLARGRRSGMVVAWLSGLAVFFDDYANCLIVGNALQPLADRLRISREKLSYIVDSTAAPIASLAIVSTWVGYQVGLFDEGLDAIGSTTDGYAFFLEVLPYSFYGIFTIGFVGAVAVTGRDFGPMLAAERRALASPAGTGAADEVHPVRFLAAAVPLTALVGVALSSLWRQGTAAAPEATRLFEVLAAADGYDAMLHASIAAVLLALAITVGGGLLRPVEAVDAALKGATTLFEALIILFLAWSLGASIGELDAAGYLVGVLGGNLAPAMLPTAVFAVAAATSFATGTSFGTMAILVPMVIPLGFALAPEGPVLLASTAAVLAGSCWGDHCSPISDTTVLSSLGCGCDHVAHVQTQLPYAVAAGLVTVLCGTLPAGLGVPAWVCIAVGTVACVGVVRFVGRRPEDG